MRGRESRIDVTLAHVEFRDSLFDSLDLLAQWQQTCTLIGARAAFIAPIADRGWRLRGSGRHRIAAQHQPRVIIEIAVVRRYAAAADMQQGIAARADQGAIV